MCCDRTDSCVTDTSVRTLGRHHTHYNKPMAPHKQFSAADAGADAGGAVATRAGRPLTSAVRAAVSLLTHTADGDSRLSSEQVPADPASHSVAASVCPPSLACMNLPLHYPHSWRSILSWVRDSHGSIMDER